MMLEEQDDWTELTKGLKPQVAEPVTPPQLEPQEEKDEWGELASGLQPAGDEIVQPTPQARRTLLGDIGEGLKETAGFAEAPLSLGSGMAYNIAGMAAQGGAALWDIVKSGGQTLYDIWKTGGKGVTGPQGTLGEAFAEKAKEALAIIGEKEDIRNQVAAWGTYQPKTEVGGMLTQVAASPFTQAVKGLEEGAKLVSDDPEVQKGIKFLGEVVLLRMLPKLTHKFKAFEGKHLTRLVQKELTKEMGREITTLAKEMDLGKTATVGGQQVFTPEGVKDVVEVIKGLKPLSRKQKASYGPEFGRRVTQGEALARKIGGKAGFKAKKGQLAGEYEKMRPDFEALEKTLSPEMQDIAYNTIEHNARLLPGEKVSAGTGFTKLLAGRLPQPRELELLQDVFGGEFVAALMKKRPFVEKAWTFGLELANIPRSLMAGFFDLSFGGRQGIFGAPRYWREFGSAWSKQFEMFGSERAYQALMDEIAHDPYFKIAREAKVQFTEMGKVLGKREERYLSPMAEKIPIIGKGIKMTGRAYTGMANKYRMDIFRRLAKDAEAMGHKLEGNPDLLKPMGQFVNAVTGRGGLWKLESAASALNAVFFSPRLWSSRMGLTFGKYQPLSPLHYVMLPKNVRVEALKTWLSFAGAGLTVLGAAKAAGAEVELDPRSSDFAKIKIGDTRVDIWGGLQQNIRTAAQFIMGHRKSTTTGKIKSVGDKDDFKPLTRWQILESHVSYKEAPLFSFAMDWMKGQTGMEPFSIKNEFLQKFTPILAQDMWDIYQDDPGLLPAGLFSIAGFFGIGIQTYEGKKKKSGYGAGF